MPTRVLVVDDDADARLLVRTSLRRLDGFEVVSEAASGAEALAVASHELDVIVLDIGLPDVRGDALIPELRRQTDAKIVLFTGQDEDVTRYAGVADGFVRKSGDMSPLLLLVEHLATTPTGASLALAMQAEAAGLARRFVESQCRAWGCEDAIDDASLIVSELVTNAVLHARSHPHLVTCLVGDVVRIEVIDDSQERGEVRIADPFDEHGRGLFIVDVLSDAWGVDGLRHGKRTWAEVPCLRRPAGAIDYI